MSHENNNISGMSLVELLVSVGVLGVFLTGAYTIYNQFQERQWAVNNQLLVKEEMQSAARVVNKAFPAAITLNNPDNPMSDPNIWSCSGETCSLVSDKQNGVELSGVCVPTKNSPILEKVPFHQVETVKASDNCFVCGEGKRPRILFKMYKNGAEVGQFKFPKTAGDAQRLLGIVGMSLCFSAPPRTQGADTFYDQWIVSLVPMYFAHYPKLTDTDSELKAKLASVREIIMLGPLEQLGSKIKVIK